MNKILQVNVTANIGSHGRIAESIGQLASSSGFESIIAYGRDSQKSSSRLIKIGNTKDMIIHGISSRLLDRHGLSSKKATIKFIQEIEKISPDIIHIHNIHGYYLNYSIFFNYIKSWGGPVVWTLHDCWAFTGHCAYYDYIGCNKWQTHCIDCPQISSYPASILKDESYYNFETKKSHFLGCQNLTIVPVSEWLSREVEKSFLRNYPRVIIKNGVDIDTFSPSNDQLNKNRYVLGVANVWEPRKGLNEFHKLRTILDPSINIILVGLSSHQLKKLPKGIIGIPKTKKIEELSYLYSNAIAFINPTFEDNFPTTNIESLACGTPVITYDTGGSREIIDSQTGIVVPQGDINGLKDGIQCIISQNEMQIREKCRQRAVKYFNQQDRFKEYIDLYIKLLD